MTSSAELASLRPGGPVPQHQVHVECWPYLQPPEQQPLQQDVEAEGGPLSVEALSPLVHMLSMHYLFQLDFPLGGYVSHYPEYYLSVRC